MIFLIIQKVKLLSSGVVNDSKFKIEKVNTTSSILVEIKKDANNTASYIDEDSGNKILFNNLVLKSIINNPKETDEYVVTPLTTLASELVLSGKSANIASAQKSVAKLFGLSFDNLNMTKPNIEGLSTTSTDSKENEYALGLLSLIAYQNDINSQS